MTDDSTAIVEISKAEQALERAADIHEMLNLRDKAAALRVFADAQGFKEAAQKAKIFQLKAERKAGAWLEENVTHGGNPQTYQDGRSVPIPDGITWNESSRWQLQASVPEEKFLEWTDECLAIGKEITAAGLQRLGRELNRDPNTPPIPKNKYRVIYADPPWKYGNTMPDYMGVQDDHYPLMSIGEICELPIKGMVEDNAVLFLWATSPILEDAFLVINAWGFDYKSSFVWDKVKHVMGHYNSVRHELLLVAVRGSCQPDVKRLFDSVYSEERTQHSKKPEYFREIIDTIYPYGKRIELFSRNKAAGWEAWGNEQLS